MKKIGMLRAMVSCSNYEKMGSTSRNRVREERLQELVKYARENSPYYAKLYKDVPDNFTLADLPSVNKKELMEHWDEWVTDRSVTLQDIQEFMKNLDNIGRKWNGKYMVFTTSGSTGNPLVMLCDNTVNNVMGAICARRSFARKEDMSAFIRGGGKSIGVFADSGFYLSNSSVRSRLLSMPWKKRQMAISSALFPTKRIVEQLNDFQPVMLGGYPSNLELLIEEQQSGRLHISPVIIMTGGEYLTDSLRKRLTDTFDCYVQTSYACTEGGAVACECRENHFHINDDWVILEPVDKDNNPVAEGTLSDKILLTNLYNETQPFIRYEVTDRVILHTEPCVCGNPSPYIELEGRNDDVITLQEKDSLIRIPPLAVYATLKEVHSLKRFQLVVKSNNELELRMETEKEMREEVFEEAEIAIRKLFKNYGVEHVVMRRSLDQPMQHPISGKFKHIINESAMYQ